MERRELLRKVGGSFILVLSPLPRPGYRKSVVGSDSKDGLSELLVEAQNAFHEQDLGRAHSLYTQAFNRATELRSSRIRADVFEGLNRTRELLNDAEESLPRHRASVQAEPENPEKCFWLAFTLMRLSRNEQALAEYKRILTLDGEWGSSCPLLIGICQYREGKFREALDWLEGIGPEDKTNRVREISDHWEALEYRLLIYAKLGLAEKAQAALQEHIKHHGRVGARQSRALSKIGIDADALYVQQALRSDSVSGISISDSPNYM